mmetsp:Transcript_13070/g.41290  ORF Transcript_13070/g.41290 Transcript_13070/m.41290 type:complete len:272 (-) Transcript_13070:28-843(-)
MPSSSVFYVQLPPSKSGYMRSAPLPSRPAKRIIDPTRRSGRPPRRPLHNILPLPHATSFETTSFEIYLVSTTSLGVVTEAFLPAMAPADSAEGFLISSSTASHFLAGLDQESSCWMHASTIFLYEGVGYTATARFTVAARAAASAGTRRSGSKAPMWKPVTPSLTVSTRPPVEATIGTVPYCMAWSWMSPQGSKREGTRMKSAPAVMRWARGAENLTTPLALGDLSSRALTCFSMVFLPVPRMASWHSTPVRSLMAAIMMSTPFCSSRRPM